MTDSANAVTELDFEVLETLLGPDWRIQKPAHLDFADPVFALNTLVLRDVPTPDALAPLNR